MLYHNRKLSNIWLLEAKRVRDSKLFCSKWNTSNLIKITMCWLKMSLMSWRSMTVRYQPRVKLKLWLLKFWKRALTKKRFQWKILRKLQHLSKNKRLLSLMMMNPLFRKRQRRIIKIYIRDINNILQSKEMMKLLIMVDTRLCIDAIRKTREANIRTEEKKDLYIHSILWIQIKWKTKMVLKTKLLKLQFIKSEKLSQAKSIIKKDLRTMLLIIQCIIKEVVIIMVNKIKKSSTTADIM